MIVWIELVDVSGEEVIYDRMSESRTADRGRLSANKKTCERKIIVKSKDDWWSEYHGHAWQRMDKAIDANEHPQETHVACCRFALIHRCE